MTFHNSGAEFFVPDGRSPDEALARTTHLAIGAHQDDLEFMAFHGIVECFHDNDKWFAGVTCTDGAGSSRVGPYAKFTDEEMRAVRKREQNEAAVLGHFGAMVQLDYPSAAMKDPQNFAPVDDLEKILRQAQAQVIYTHNPADKHDAHVAVTVKTIEAIRRLSHGERPRQVFGCEVWRGLDWMLDGDKVSHDVTGHDSLAAALNGVFDSQIAGGKNYDRATIGRRSANATFFDPRSNDRTDQLMFAMDLSPLVQDDSLDITEYTMAFVRRFEADVLTRLQKMRKA